jgi:hypothetical protein
VQFGELNRIAGLGSQRYDRSGLAH